MREHSGASSGAARRSQTQALNDSGDAAPSLAQLDLSAIAGSLGYHLRRAQVAEFQAFAETFAAYDIRPVQYAILALLHDNPGIKQSQLGEALSIKRANQVALIDELEERALVTRRQRTDDRRSHALHLTAAGKKLTKKLLALHAEHEARFARQLGAKERAQLLGLLKQFLQAAPAAAVTTSD